jgi:hypothetical protein
MLGDDEMPDNDLYVQEFFLQLYSQLSLNRENFVESEEGHTYILKSDHDKVVPAMLHLFRQQKMSQEDWDIRIREYRRELEL